MPTECFTNLREMFDAEKLSDTEISDILRVVEQHKGKSDFNKLSIKERDRMVQNEQFKAATQLNRALADRDLKNRGDMLSSRGLKPKQVMETLAGSHYVNAPGANINVSSVRKALFGQWAYALEDATKGFEKYLGGEFDLPLARTIEAINKKIPIPTDIPSDIAQLGTNLHKWNRRMVSDLQAIGVYLNVRDDFLWRQSHNQATIRTVTGDKWIKDIYEEIDWNITFEDIADATERKKILHSIYDEIVSGEYENQVGTFGGKRTLHFKDAESFTRYNKVYGNGTAYDVMRQTLNSAAKYGSLTQVLGPDYKKGWENLKKHLYDKSDDATKLSLKSDHVGSEGRRIDNLWKEITSKDQTPEANIGVKVLNVQKDLSAASKLGRAFSTTFTDYGLSAQMMTKMSGEIILPFKPMLTALKMMTNKAERQKYSRMANLYVGNLMKGAFDRYGMMSAPIGKQTWWTKFNNTVHSLNGLEFQANANRAGVVQFYSQLLANDSLTVTRFDQLSNIKQSNLQRWGIDADNWHLIKHAIEDVDGDKFITSEAATNIDLDLLTEYAAKKGITKQKAKSDINLAVSTFLGDHARLGSLEAGVLEKSIALQGHHPNSTVGSILSSLWQFKSFALSANRGLKHVAFMDPAVTGTKWKDIFTQQQGIKAMAGAAAYLMPMALGGLLLRDLANGREPRNIDEKAIFEAMQMSIIPIQLGITLDILSGEYAKSNRNLAKDLLGPVIGQVADLGQLGSLLVDDMMNTPANDRPKFGRSLKKAIDYSMQNIVPSAGVAGMFWTPLFHQHTVDQIKEYASPGYIDRREKYYSERGMNSLY